MAKKAVKKAPKKAVKKIVKKVMPVKKPVQKTSVKKQLPKKPVKAKSVRKPVKAPKKPVQKAKPVTKPKVQKPKSLSQVAPHEAEQIHELLLPKHEEVKQIPDWTAEPNHPAAPQPTPVEPAQPAPEVPKEEPKQELLDQPSVPTEPVKGDILLKVNVRKFLFRSVRNVEVLLMQNDKPIDRQITDSNGTAYFKNVSVGQYTLAVTVDGKFKTKPVNVKDLGSVTFNV